MLKAKARKSKPRQVAEHPPFECTALLLQGGGALGSYQAGVYQALAEANLQPDWVAGISIGAINSALGIPPLRSIEPDEFTRRLINQTRALGILLFGAPDFFKPRVPSPFFWPFHAVDSVSHYDVAPLKATLERLVDFDRINAGDMRFSVGAVNVRTGNFTYFDSTTHHITPAHVIASGSLPPGFPAAEIEGEYYWDGGLVSNTPLQWVLDSRPRQDTLAFQVDLWSSDGEMPRDLIATEVRQKEIRFSSRTRAATDQYKKSQKLRLAVANLIKQLPAEARRNEDVKMLAAEADDKICNIVQLVYQTKKYEGVAKDFEFSRRPMEEHWKAGYDDAVRALSHPEVLQRPDKLEGVRTFDFRKK
jgi:NTE family protein